MAGDHPNVLPFWGIRRNPEAMPGEPSAAALVMPWLEDGNVLEYLYHNPKSWQEKLRIVSPKFSLF
jgi:hypothetical protein